MRINRHATVWLTAIAVSNTAGLQAAHAGMIAPDAVAANALQSEAHADVAARRAAVQDALNRGDVAQALVAKGVNMDAARARINLKTAVDSPPSPISQVLTGTYVGLAYSPDG